MAGDGDGDRFVVDNVGVHVNSVVNHGCGNQWRKWMVGVGSFLGSRAWNKAYPNKWRGERVNIFAQAIVKSLTT